jgi:hypothetical protein
VLSLEVDWLSEQLLFVYALHVACCTCADACALKYIILQTGTTGVGRGQWHGTSSDQTAITRDSIINPRLAYQIYWYGFFSQDRTVHRVGRVLSLFSSRRNWDSPKPSPAGGSGGRGTLIGEKGGGRVPIPFRRGDVHCGTLHMFVLCETVSVEANEKTTCGSFGTLPINCYHLSVDF